MILQKFRDFRKSVALSAISHGYAKPSGYFEKFRELQYLKEFFDRHDPELVIDVGANVGQFAAEVRSIGYKGDIISFEPDEQQYITLSERFKSDKRWRGLCVALGSTSGTGTLFVAGDSVLTSLHRPLENEIISERKSIEILRLDEVLTERFGISLGTRIFLKTDTQGHDLEVIKGSEEIMASVVGMLVELTETPMYSDTICCAAALEEFASMGYAVVNKSVVRRNSDLTVAEWNCLLQKGDVR